MLIWVFNIKHHQVEEKQTSQAIKVIKKITQKVVIKSEKVSRGKCETDEENHIFIQKAIP